MPPMSRVPLVSKSSSATMRPIRPPQPETPILSSAICCSRRLKLREGPRKCKRGAATASVRRIRIAGRRLLRCVGGTTAVARMGAEKPGHDADQDDQHNDEYQLVQILAVRCRGTIGCHANSPAVLTPA